MEWFSNFQAAPEPIVFFHVSNCNKVTVIKFKFYFNLFLLSSFGCNQSKLCAFITPDQFLNDIAMAIRKPSEIQIFFQAILTFKLSIAIYFGLCAFITHDQFLSNIATHCKQWINHPTDLSFLHNDQSCECSIVYVWNWHAGVDDAWFKLRYEQTYHIHERN